jgi:hypothetical protein
MALTFGEFKYKVPFENCAPIVTDSHPIFFAEKSKNAVPALFYNLQRSLSFVNFQY